MSEIPSSGIRYCYGAVKADSDRKEGEDKHANGSRAKVFRQTGARLESLDLLALGFGHLTNYQLLNPRRQAEAVYFPAKYSPRQYKPVRCANRFPRFALLIARRRPTRQLRTVFHLDREVAFLGVFPSSRRARHADRALWSQISASNFRAPNGSRQARSLNQLQIKRFG